MVRLLKEDSLFGSWAFDATLVKQSVDEMIISPSGWRKIFNINKNPEGGESQVSPQDLLIVALIATLYIEFQKRTLKKESLRVAIGADSRPTGSALVNVIISTLIAAGVKVSYLSVTPVPEIMAYVQKSERLDGFIYVSASHNPVGYNGIKLSSQSGNILSAEESHQLIKEFYQKIEEPASLKELLSKVDSIKRESSAIKAIYRQAKKNRRESMSAYYTLLLRTLTGSCDKSKEKQRVASIRKMAKKRGVTVVAEFNGSARATSIDVKLLTHLGIKVITANATPGQFVHPIIPEGSSLSLCQKLVDSVEGSKRSLILGYVPDCDGDRGNLVYRSLSKGGGVPDAQTVFATTTICETAFQLQEGLTSPAAIVVNGPTSGRIDAIAERFGIDVFRCEVGEANVVSLAEKLKEKGYQVPVLGEGSNGGSIIPPSKTRDPLGMVLSLLRFFLFSDSGNSSPSSIWRRALKGEAVEFNSLEDFIKTIPSYITTETEDPEAKIVINEAPQRGVKRAYQELFGESWNKRREELKEWGIESYEQINYRGTTVTVGQESGDSLSCGGGGLKILFRDEKENPVAFIWMRKSGTEPLYRLLADCQGERRELERYLINWQRELIKEAAKRASLTPNGSKEEPS